MAKDVKKSMSIGTWTFLIGVLIAIIAGIIVGMGTTTDFPAWTASILVLLGLVVGFLNVTSKESSSFLLSTVALVLVSWMGGDIMGKIALVGPILGGILSAIMLLLIPAVIIVALKSIYALARD